MRLEGIIWALEALCAVHGKPFDRRLVLQHLPASAQPQVSDGAASDSTPPQNADLTNDDLITLARAIGFTVSAKQVPKSQLGKLPMPLLVQPSAAADANPDTGLGADSASAGKTADYALLIAVQDGHALLLSPGQQVPTKTLLAELPPTIGVLLAKLVDGDTKDPDAVATRSGAGGQPFGFRWFVPDLLKHRRVWRDVLGASLVLQLLALAFPLFTQAVIDKVVVHRTESTLLALGIAMALFVLFTGILTWVRQYLILHTGNRVDAVLGASVFEHLFRLPVRYFEARPTGVIAARLNGVETIREFIASAAVSLILDLPFLLIAVGVMFWYSVPLTLMALGILSLIAILSFIVAPVFFARLNQQFLLGARNQAFLTEHIAAAETVKSLQMEPVLRRRYGEYLAAYLQSGFRTRQIGNTYQTISSTLEQVMTLAVLIVGAWIVMHPTPESAFTIGMLVAFQMFAGKISQPLLRIVGLWQQFQEANLAVQRLGDLMNAPAEPYTLSPKRQSQAQGRIEIEGLAFRYGDDTPLLYESLTLAIQPGQAVAIMGPSGSGKSTLAKLLQGFYRPTAGSIRLDAVDVRHLAANELRAGFGVVPQETVLFSGTVYDNLLAANPHASFDDIVTACRQAEIHDTIEKMPAGYQTELGERGVGLSGGQRQRLAIARALIKRAPVLVFDEATSALDAATAEQFAKTVNALRQAGSSYRPTMIFITHALPKALVVDDVYILRDGSLRKAVRSVQPATAVVGGGE